MQLSLIYPLISAQSPLTSVTRYPRYLPTPTEITTPCYKTSYHTSYYRMWHTTATSTWPGCMICCSLNLVQLALPTFMPHLLICNNLLPPLSLNLLYVCKLSIECLFLVEERFLYLSNLSTYQFQSYVQGLLVIYTLKFISTYMLLLLTTFHNHNSLAIP